MTGLFSEVFLSALLFGAITAAIPLHRAPSRVRERRSRGLRARGRVAPPHVASRVLRRQ